MERGGLDFLIFVIDSHQFLFPFLLVGSLYLRTSPLLSPNNGLGPPLDPIRLALPQRTCSL